MNLTTIQVSGNHTDIPSLAGGWAERVLGRQGQALKIRQLTWVVGRFGAYRPLACPQPFHSGSANVGLDVGMNIV